MPHFLRCPQGHHWQVSLDDTTLADGGPRCPNCGASGILESLHALPTPAAPPDATFNEPAPPPSVEDELPSLPGYTVLRRIGRGGFGEVYLARQLLPDRVVAVKLLHAGAVQAERFEREASVLARLDHGNVVRVLAGGRSADGRLFLALEYVDGGGLESYLRKQPQPPAEAARLVEILARAVHYLHEQGVIHRDLKPANVLVRQDGTLKLTDFGLAKYREDGQSLTATGGILGTPSYMAPEQASGHGKAVTPAADVYALGAILYEALTGRPPFLGATPLETLHHVLTDEPVPPARLQPSVPRALETVCLKCLEKKPERRYAAAAELADDLRRFLDGQAVAARRAGPAVRLARWVRRHPAASGLAAAAVLALAGLVGYLWQAARTAEALAANEAVERRLREAKVRQAEGLVLKARYDDRQPGQREAVFRAIRQFGELRQEADRDAERLSRLGGPAEALARQDRELWQAWADRLRQEAARWLTAMSLYRARTVPLPERPGEKPYAGDLPAVALHPDGQRLALVYPGATEALLLDLGGKVLDRLAVPEDFARKARVRESVVRETPRYRRSTVNTTYAPARFAFAGPDRLEYQVRQEMLVWDLPRGKRPRREQLPPHRLPKMPYGNRVASSPAFFAAADGKGTAVTVRDWEPRASPVMAWQAESGERLARLAFGGDGRSLFVLSDTRLAVADAATGARAEVMLEDPEHISFGAFIPCPGGVAQVERRGDRDHVEPPRLVFWTAALPEARVHALRHDEPPRCLSADGAGGRRLTVVGTPDHLVQAWRGPARLWEAGIPYLGARAGKPSPRLRTAGPGAPLTGTGFSQTIRPTVGAGRPTERQQVREQYAAPLQPYPWWGFTPDGALVVERQVVAADGRARLPTEVYSADGGLRAIYPAEGKGRILAATDDRRLAVVVTDEDAGQGTLEVWSLPERRRPLGRLGRYPLPPGAAKGPSLHVSLLTTPSRKDYLLLAWPDRPAGGAELEVWRIAGQPERVGRLALPGVCTSAFLTPDENRAIVWRPRSVGAGPYFARVIDLENAVGVCELEGFGATGNLDVTRMSAKHLVYAARQGLSGDINEPFRVGCWDLRSGKRTPLDAEPWRAADAPEIELSPDGTRVAFCGRLDQTGAGYARLYDLDGGKPLWQSPRFPWPARPWLPTAFAECAVVAVDDYPAPGQVRILHVRWADGQPADPPVPGSARVLDIQPDPLGRSGWLLWRDGGGLYLQKGVGAPKGPRLENVSGRFGGILWPGPRGGPLLMRLDGRDGLWDADSGHQVARLPAGEECLRFDAARRWILTRSPAAAEFRIRDARSGAEVCRFSARGGGFDLTQAPWRLHPEGKRLAVLAQGLLRVWDLEADRPVLTVPPAGHGAPVDCVAQHAGAGLVASGGADGVILLWRRDRGRLVRPIPAHRAAVTALAFSPDGKRLASASGDGEVAVHDAEGKSVWAARVAPGKRVNCLAYAPVSGSLVAGTDDGRLAVLDPRTGRRTGRHDTGLGPVRALAFAPGKDTLAVAGAAGVQLWDAGRMERHKHWPTPAPVAALAFVGGGRLLAVAGEAVEFWDTQAERPAGWALDVPHGPVRALAVNEHTGELAIAGRGGDVLVYDLPDLHGRLDRLGLAFAAFPAERWARPAEPTPAKAPGLAEWRRLAEELHERRQWQPLLWVCYTALAEHPDDARLGRLRREAEARSGAGPK